MYKFIYRTFEICSIICLIHYAYGKQLKLDKKMCLLIIFDLSILKFLDTYVMNTVWFILPYVCIATYILIEFPYDFWKSLICNLYYIIVLSILQLFWGMIILNINMEFLQNDIGICIVNLAVLITIIILKKNIYEYYAYLVKRNKKVLLIVFNFFAILFLNLMGFKIHKYLTAEQLVTLLVFGGMLMISLYFWQQENIKRKQKEMELKIHKIYEDSYAELIDSIRKRQHEFHNHLQAILCMHYTINTYDELVKKQYEYFEIMRDNNKFYSLLTNSWPILIGFLYGKLQEADDKNIKILYDIKLTGKRSVKIPEYILIEILGILLDNAIEAVEKVENAFIHIEIKEKNCLEIIIINPIDEKCQKNVSDFFVKGYSNKNGHEGLGLNKICDYQKQFRFSKKVAIKEIENTFCFSVELQIDWLK